MRLRILRSSAFVFASTALIAMGMSVAAEAGGKYKGKDKGDYCEAKLDKIQSQYQKFLIKYEDVLLGDTSTKKYRQAAAKDAKFMHKISSFSFADCTCDDDDDCDVSRS